MAIDTKSLTDIITEFRALQSKDAVSPESLGYILQRIVDLLATAGTSETVSNITKLLDGFKAAGQAITALSQGQADRNHIYANKSTVNLATGAVSASSELFIQQATTERSSTLTAPRNQSPNWRNCFPQFNRRLQPSKARQVTALFQAV